MALLSVLVSLATAGVLVWAGLEKLRPTAGFHRTLEALGLPTPVARFGAYAVPAVELATAGGLLVLPGQLWPRLGVAGLGIAFAAAGLLSLRLGRPVACSCFGATGGGTLGWRQVAMLPGWLAVAAVLQLWPPSWSAEEGIQYAAFLVVLLAAVRGFQVARAWRAAAGDRIAMVESEVQRRPIFLQDMEEGVTE